MNIKQHHSDGKELQGQHKNGIRLEHPVAKLFQQTNKALVILNPIIFNTNLMPLYAIPSQTISNSNSKTKIKTQRHQLNIIFTTERPDLATLLINMEIYLLFTITHSKQTFICCIAIRLHEPSVVHLRDYIKAPAPNF